MTHRVEEGRARLLSGDDRLEQRGPRHPPASLQREGAEHASVCGYISGSNLAQAVTIAQTLFAGHSRWLRDLCQQSQPGGQGTMGPEGTVVGEGASAGGPCAGESALPQPGSTPRDQGRLTCGRLPFPERCSRASLGPGFPSVCQESARIQESASRVEIPPLPIQPSFTPSVRRADRGHAARTPPFRLQTQNGLPSANITKISSLRLNIPEGL